MLGGPPADDGSDEQNAMLRRLAKALDIAPTAFFDVSDYDLSQTNELLHLWHGITDRADRAKVLAIVRSIASRACGERLIAFHKTGCVNGKSFA